MVGKLNSIFDETFKISTWIKKRGFTYFLKEILKKISALNSLRKKGTSLTPGENEVPAERVGSYPYLYDKTFKNIKKRM